MRRLDGRIAVVTGGSSGIGLGIAKRFIAEGAKVAITGRNPRTLDRALGELGPSAVGISGDVAKLGDLERIYREVGSRLGKVDALVINAGVYVLAPLAEFTEEQLDTVSDINFKGRSSAFRKRFQFSRMAHRSCWCPRRSTGKASPTTPRDEAAVRSLARSFSADLLARRIRVNTLTPGPIDTPVFRSVTSNETEAKAMAAAMGEFTPVKRLGTPDEIASAAAFLASDESKFMLGAEILVDGGLRDL